MREVFLFCGLLIMAMGCDKVEGCLDPNASNYSIEAEDHCCCEYPPLRINISYKINDEDNLTLEEAFTNSSGDSITISRFVFYASGFELEDKDGRIYKTIDEIELNDDIYTDDIIRFERSRFQYEPGEINVTQPLRRISFHLGLPQDIKSIDPGEEMLPQGHPLRISTDSLYTDNMYLFGKMGFMVDTTAFQFTLTQEIALQFDLDTVPVLGEPVSILIEMRFDEWFDSIVSTMDEQEILDQLTAILPTIFSLE